MTFSSQKQETGGTLTALLGREEAAQMLKETPGWTLKDNAIEREFKFGSFREAIDFVNRVADIADAEDHHPDIYVSYNSVRLELSTHKVGGLTKKDFAVAASVDRLACMELDPPTPGERLV